MLESDYSNCLRRLFKYPPVEDVRIFIQKAQDLLNPKAKPAQPAVKRPAYRPQSKTSAAGLNFLSETVRDVLQDDPTVSCYCCLTHCAGVNVMHSILTGLSILNLS